MTKGVLALGRNTKITAKNSAGVNRTVGEKV